MLMAWIELHQTLPKNKKIMRLKRLLKIKTPQAIGHVCMLWLWALDNAPDGNLSDFSDEDIAEICEWTKNSEIFLRSLIDSGFVDEIGNQKIIHEWSEYAGRLMDKRNVQREQARMRQQRYRERLKSNQKSDENSHSNNKEVTRYDSVSNAPIQYLTVPNPTVPLYGDEYGACARENTIHFNEEFENPPQLSEEILNHYENMRRISALPEDVKARFYSTVDSLYSTMWAKTPTEYDYANIYRLLLWLHRKKGNSETQLEMGEDDINILSHSFDAAAMAGAKNLSYVSGVFKRYKERGIQSDDDFWDYEFKRNRKKGGW